MCLKRDSSSGNPQFKSNLKVKKRFRKRFSRLKQAERRSHFLKNEPSFTFFKKSAEQRLELQLHTACRTARKHRREAHLVFKIQINYNNLKIIVSDDPPRGSAINMAKVKRHFIIYIVIAALALLTLSSCKLDFRNAWTSPVPVDNIADGNTALLPSEAPASEAPA
ncbi:MAG: hypothetical protein IKI42_09030, partial [Clostridia bacterium]|nr:hypothetical protein [Clostridia bacterium]